MKTEVLFLAQKMSLGFGVSVVVHALSTELALKGITVAVACTETDDSFEANYPIHKIAPTTQAVDQLAATLNAATIIAHTSPYFELLPRLNSPSSKWAWEHGDPSPDLFPFDREERKSIADYKKHSVYPMVDKVIAISKFIRSDIQWPRAKVIYNGCDHIIPAARRSGEDKPFRVGTLMRLGKGEAYYKGNQLYLELVNLVRESNPDVEFHLMGRGSEEDGRPFHEAGVAVHLNASDEDRSRYLADLDIFASMSLWEGFNLPLVEAAISGALPFALDTGAHPEVTPYVFSSLPEMGSCIKQMSELSASDMILHSGRVAGWSKARFNWSQSAGILIEELSRASRGGNQI